MNLTGIVAFAVGSLLIYSGIKNLDPRDVVKQALGGPKAEGFTKDSPYAGGGPWGGNTGNGAAGAPSSGAPNLGDGNANLPVWT